MIIKSGSYVGTGSAGLAVTTGNAPDFILLKILTTNGPDAENAVAKTSTMAADAVKDLNSNTLGLETGVITSLSGTGFVVGTDPRANKSGFTYCWLSVEDDGAGDFEVGSYSGNGTDNRNISLASITGTPAWVGVFTEYTVGAFHRTNIHSGDASGWWHSVASHTTNGIQSFAAGQFQVGTRDHVNRGTGTPTYHYMAFTEVADKFEVVSWTGNGSDDQSVTGAGFEPTFSLQQRISGTAQTIALRSTAHVGDLCSLLSGVADAADRIQAFEADGHQVGTAVQVNTNTGAYAALFFLSEGEVTSTVDADLPNLTSASSASQAFPGTAAALLPNLEAAAAAAETLTATGAATLPRMRAAAAAASVVSSAGAAILPALTASAVGSMFTALQAAATLPSLEARAFAVVNVLAKEGLVISNAAARAMADTLASQIDGGTAAIICLYTGTRPADVDTAVTTQTLLAVMTMSATAFAAAIDAAPGGKIIAASILPDLIADATGIATWGRIYTQSGGAAVVDFTVGIATDIPYPNLVLNSASITAGQIVGITSFSITMPESDPD